MISYPRIAILMAVYEPNMNWLKQQLLSLNEQTYPNVMLYIRDDCSQSVPFEMIEECVHRCIYSFPFVLERNSENLGSNKTFEMLTRRAEGTYFAYCDQDDIWMPEKLYVLYDRLNETDAVLACSDMQIIDGNDRLMATHMREARKHFRPLSGEGLAEQLLIRNWISGCTMLLVAELAKQAVPFCPYMVHDHYLGLFCAAQGRLEYCSKTLIRYRIHGGNQTGILLGAEYKEGYLSTRILPLIERLRWLQKYFPFSLEPAVSQALQWAQARKSYLLGMGNGRTVWKLRRFGPTVSLFELMMPIIPDRLFRWIIRQLQQNRF